MGLRPTRSNTVQLSHQHCRSGASAVWRSADSPQAIGDRLSAFGFCVVPRLGLLKRARDSRNSRGGRLTADR